MNRKEGIIVGTVILASFITGVFAVPESQMLNMFVTNFPDKGHLGQDVSSHVALNCYNTSGSTALICTRVLPDGTLSPNFEVPAQRVLVVTDVTWAVTIGGVSAGSMCQFVIGVEEPSGFSTPIFTSNTVVDANGTMAASEHMTTGFVVSSIAQMSWGVIGCSGGYTAGAVNSFYLYGYMKTA